MTGTGEKGASDMDIEEIQSNRAVDLLAENKQLRGLLKHAICPNCDGSGAIPHQVSRREYVSRDMALDAGDPSLEGSLCSEEQWESEQCQWCYEKNQALKSERIGKCTDTER